MIIFSEERYVPTDVNMMVLAQEGAGYFYVHRMLYNQAVILEYLYENDLPRLITAVTNETHTFADIRQDVLNFYEEVPSPIKYLAPFLYFVKGELNSTEDCAGAIHVMSSVLNFAKMLSTPYDMRPSMSFSMSIKEEYALAWDRFFMTALPYDGIVRQSFSGTPMNGTETLERNTVVDTRTEDEVFEDEMLALMEDIDDDIFNMPKDYKAATAEELKEDVVAPVVETPAPVVQETPKPVSILDALKGALS